MPHYLVYTTQSDEPDRVFATEAPRVYGDTLNFVVYGSVSGEQARTTYSMHHVVKWYEEGRAAE